MVDYVVDFFVFVVFVVFVVVLVADDAKREKQTLHIGPHKLRKNELLHTTINN